MILSAVANDMMTTATALMTTTATVMMTAISAQQRCRKSKEGGEGGVKEDGDNANKSDGAVLFFIVGNLLWGCEGPPAATLFISGLLQY